MKLPARTAAPFTLAALVVLAALALTGCPPGPTYVVQQYPGAPRPTETVAILRVVGREPVQLAGLDGETIGAPVASDARLHLELLPGRHEVTARPGPADAPKRAAFLAEAGKVYRIVFDAGRARVVEVDRSSDTLGRDVTMDDAPREAAPPPPRPTAARSTRVEVDTPVDVPGWPARFTVPGGWTWRPGREAIVAESARAGVAVLGAPSVDALADRLVEVLSAQGFQPKGAAGATDAVVLGGRRYQRVRYPGMAVRGKPADVDVGVSPLDDGRAIVWVTWIQADAGADGDHATAAVGSLVVSP